MKINASEWSSHVKSVKIPVPPKCNIHVLAAGEGELMLIGHAIDEEVGSPILHSVTERLHLKANIEGFAAIEITGKRFGLQLSVNGTQLGEKLDKLPPPVKPEPRNLIAKMREKYRQEMGSQREAFAQNDTGQPGHELDDDAPGIFEEDELELAERNLREQQAKADKAKAKKSTKPKGEQNNVDEEGDSDAAGSDDGSEE